MFYTYFVKDCGRNFISRLLEIQRGEQFNLVKSRIPIFDVLLQHFHIDLFDIYIVLYANPDILVPLAGSSSSA